MEESNVETSQEKAETWKEHEDEKKTRKGEDLPFCMRSKDDEVEVKNEKNETNKRQREQQKRRHLDGDVLLSMRSKDDEKEG